MVGVVELVAFSSSSQSADEIGESNLQLSMTRHFSEDMAAGKSGKSSLAVWFGNIVVHLRVQK